MIKREGRNSQWFKEKLECRYTDVKKKKKNDRVDVLRRKKVQHAFF